METVLPLAEMKDFSPEQIETLHKVAEFAEARYSNLPYHNWSHASVDTLGEAMRLCDYCEENGQQVDRFRVAIAALCHDIDFDKPVPPGLNSKEEHSAYNTAMFLYSIGVDQPTIEGVVTDILGTECGGKCEEPETKIVRRADLSNVGGGYWNFSRNTVLLIWESVKLSKRPFDPTNLRSVIDASCQVLGSYVDDDLSLGDFDDEYKRRFLPNALRNIIKLQRETPSSLRRAFSELWVKITNQAQ